MIETGRFWAVDEDGREYLVLAYRDALIVRTKSQPDRFVDHVEEYRLEDGRILQTGAHDDGEFVIVDTGESIWRASENFVPLPARRSIAEAGRLYAQKSRIA